MVHRAGWRPAGDGWAQPARLAAHRAQDGSRWTADQRDLPAHVTRSAQPAPSPWVTPTGRLSPRHGDISGSQGALRPRYVSMSGCRRGAGWEAKRGGANTGRYSSAVASVELLGSVVQLRSAGLRPRTPMHVDA